MKSVAIILVLCLFVSLPVTAKEVTLKHKFMEGTLVLKIDDAKINPETVKKYLIVHPVAYDSNYHIAPSLLLCIEKDQRYFPCGKRDYNSEHFLNNAKVNIDIGLERLEYLDRLNTIPSLNKLVAYFRKSLSFSIWKNEQLFNYYHSWNIEVLKEQYPELAFSPEVYDSLRSLEIAKSMEERWNISFYKWSNAVNNLYRHQEGEIPKSEWDDFLKKYGISEHIEWDAVN